MVYLAAWKVATDGNDPYYVRLQEGAYASHRPAGTSRPCGDTSKPCSSGNNPYEFTQKEQIAVVVIMSTGALVLLILGTWYIIEWLKFRKQGSGTW